MALSTRTTSFTLPGYNWRRGKRAWDKHTWLYIAVILAVVLGATVGLLWPEAGVALKPLGTAFVALIKMMIAPIIFCTIVVGVGSIAKAATVGKIGGLALLYFMVMSTFALAIGLVVGNLLHPGEGLNMANSTYEATAEAKTTQEFILGIIPTTFFSAFTGESVLQVLFIALLVGFALQQMGDRGAPIMNAVKHLQALVFRILGMILWLAPIGAFGAIAAVVGTTGVAAIWALGTLMVAFYITCVLFIASGMGAPMSIGQQIGLLVFMIIASKGAAGVTGAGLATLAGGLQAYRPDLVNGVGVIVGIDRFMSEGRAVTNFTGNAVATVLIGTWTKEFDVGRARRVLNGELPFDETTMVGDHDGMSTAADAVGAQGLEEAAIAEAAAKEERARAREASVTR